MKWPWWLSICLAILSYAGLKYGLPLLVGEEILPEEFLKLLAPLTAIGFLLLGAKQLYDIPSADQDFQNQTGDKNLSPDDEEET